MPQPTPAEELNAAIRNNDPDAVRYWLIAGASLTVKVGQSGSSASVLNRWVARGALELWPVLAAYARPVINQRPRNSHAPLAAAAKHNRIEVMPLLLAAGANLDGEMDGNNPLMCAVRYKSHRAVDRLLELGARTDVRTSTGNGLLHEALLHQGTDLWPRLITAGADIGAVNAMGQDVPALIRTALDAERQGPLLQAWESLVLQQAVHETLSAPGLAALPSLDRVRL